MELDAKNGNHLWRDSERQELEQIDEYEAFKDQGFKAAPPPGYKRIRVHMVYAIKHDLLRQLPKLRHARWDECTRLERPRPTD